MEKKYRQILFYDIYVSEDEEKRTEEEKRTRKK